MIKKVKYWYKKIFYTYGIIFFPIVCIVLFVSLFFNLRYTWNTYGKNTANYENRHLEHFTKRKNPDFEMLDRHNYANGNEKYFSYYTCTQGICNHFATSTKLSEKEVAEMKKMLIEKEIILNEKINNLEKYFQEQEKLMQRFLNF